MRWSTVTDWFGDRLPLSKHTEKVFKLMRQTDAKIVKVIDELERRTREQDEYIRNRWSI